MHNLWEHIMEYRKKWKNQIHDIFISDMVIPAIMHGILRRFLMVGRYLLVVWGLWPGKGLVNKIQEAQSWFDKVQHPRRKLGGERGKVTNFSLVFPSCDCHVPMMDQSNPAWKCCLVETVQDPYQLLAPPPSCPLGSTASTMLMCWQVPLPDSASVAGFGNWTEDIGALGNFQWQISKRKLSIRHWRNAQLLPRPLAQPQQAPWQLATGTANASSISSLRMPQGWRSRDFVEKDGRYEIQ